MNNRPNVVIDGSDNLNYLIYSFMYNKETEDLKKLCKQTKKKCLYVHSEKPTVIKYIQIVQLSHM